VLAETYPDAHIELDFKNPFQLLVATVLSAQTTDKRVNLTTPALFAKYPTPEDLAAANPEDVAEILRPTGDSPKTTSSSRVDRARPQDLRDILRVGGCQVLGVGTANSAGVVRLTRLSVVCATAPWPPAAETGS